MEKDQPEVETVELDEEENKAEVSPLPAYNWVQEKRGALNMMITMTDDVDELSTYTVGEQLFKSHVYSALGAALFEGSDIIIWIDWPLELVKARSSPWETKRVYWGENIKARRYNLLENNGDYFGLSPAMQEFRIKMDATLVQYGLHLRSSQFDFTEEWDDEVRYLVLSIAQVNKEPTKSNIKRWLGMNKEDTDREVEKTIKDLKMRAQNKKRQLE